MNSIEQLKSKRILILGGSGFLGSNLVHYLLEQDCDRITVMTEKQDERIDYNLGNILDKINIEIADIRYEKEIEELIRNNDVIFDFAAHSGAVDSTDKPFLNLDINGKGTLNVLDSCRKYNPEARVIFISSRLIYGKPTQIPVSETEVPNPGNIYAVHKLLGEYYMKVYAELYGLNTIILRLTNPYGPRQPFWQSQYGIINFFIYKAIKNEEITIFGEGDQLRDYLYIDDVSNIIAKIGYSQFTPGSVYNLGSGAGIRFIEMAEKIVDIVGSGSIKKIPWPALHKKVETGDFVSDISKIKKQFRWEPEIKLEEGIKKTYDFIKSHPKFLKRAKGEV